MSAPWFVVQFWTENNGPDFLLWNISESNAQAVNAEFKSNYDDGSVFMGKVLSHPVSFILMLGAWRAGLKGLSAMSKGGENTE